MDVRATAGCALLLVACGAGPEGSPPTAERTAALLPVLEIVEVTRFFDAYFVRGRLTNPTDSTWCLVGEGGLAAAGVQVPAWEGSGWMRDPDGFLCGTGLVEMELGPQQTLETFASRVADRHRTVRLTVRLWQRPAPQAAGDVEVEWPDDFKLPVHSQPVDPAAVQVGR